jgi:hypothetical protein
VVRRSISHLQGQLSLRLAINDHNTLAGAVLTWHARATVCTHGLLLQLLLLLLQRHSSYYC